eukprot:UN4915
MEVCHCASGHSRDHRQVPHHRPHFITPRCIHDHVSTLVRECSVHGSLHLVPANARPRLMAELLVAKLFGFGEGRVLRDGGDVAVANCEAVRGVGAEQVPRRVGLEHALSVAPQVLLHYALLDRGGVQGVAVAPGAGVGAPVRRRQPRLQFLSDSQGP